VTVRPDWLLAKFAYSSTWSPTLKVAGIVERLPPPLSVGYERATGVTAVAPEKAKRVDAMRVDARMRAGGRRTVNSWRRKDLAIPRWPDR
jgi:hypothetical protein